MKAHGSTHSPVTHDFMYVCKHTLDALTPLLLTACSVFWQPHHSSLFAHSISKGGPSPIAGSEEGGERGKEQEDEGSGEEEGQTGEEREQEGGKGREERKGKGAKGEVHI